MEATCHSKSEINVHPVERWLSGLGGGILTVSGLARGRKGWLRTASGVLMLRRALTGHCPVYSLLGVNSTGTAPANELLIRTHASATIDQPREKVFEFWRRLENLPRFIRHLTSIERIDEKRSHWTAHGPGSWQVEWDAEIVEEVPNERIVWRSVPGSDVDSAGLARFQDAPGHGTEVRVELRYAARGGIVAAYVARMFGPEPEQEVAADLDRLKQYLESGEASVGALAEPPNTDTAATKGATA